jgi:serine/threonine-protein kinase HipA
MIFNAVIGNDDDHPKNHAVVFSLTEQRWRLSPAFDVVPNPDETPKYLTLQVSAGTYDITRAALLADATRFGFTTHEDAANQLDDLLARIQSTFNQVAPILTDAARKMLAERLSINVKLLA